MQKSTRCASDRSLITFAEHLWRLWILLCCLMLMCMSLCYFWHRSHPDRINTAECLRDATRSLLQWSRTHLEPGKRSPLNASTEVLWGFSPLKLLHMLESVTGQVVHLPYAVWRRYKKCPESVTRGRHIIFYANLGERINLPLKFCLCCSPNSCCFCALCVDRSGLSWSKLHGTLSNFLWQPSSSGLKRSPFPNEAQTGGTPTWVMPAGQPSPAQPWVFICLCVWGG